MVVSTNSRDTDVVNAYNLREKASSVGRQSLADKWREMVPALRDPRILGSGIRFQRRSAIPCRQMAGSDSRPTEALSGYLCSEHNDSRNCRGRPSVSDIVARGFQVQELDFCVGRQSLADKWREMVPALRDPRIPGSGIRF